MTNNWGRTLEDKILGKKITKWVQRTISNTAVPMNSWRKKMRNRLVKETSWNSASQNAVFELPDVNHLRYLFKNICGIPFP